MTAPRSSPRLTSWPDPIEALAQRVGRLEVEAELVLCDPVRAARLRQLACELAARLEAAKAATVAGEVA